MSDNESTRAPQDDRGAAVRALREAADQLPAMTEGERRGGTAHWTSDRDRDTYSLAIEEAQAALRARADALAATPEARP